MWKVFVAAVVFIGLCVLGLGFNIFFRKGGHFPHTDISTNPDMQRLGIKCPRQEELEALEDAGKAGETGPDGFGDTGTDKRPGSVGKPSACTGIYSDACKACALYGKH